LDLPETRHLVAFTTVLEAGGFTRAAEALNLTQSALSHQIKTLEELLGVEVLARIGKRTMLTQAGEILLKHATVVLRELAEARQSLLELRDPGRERLRIVRRAIVATCCSPVFCGSLRLPIPASS